MKHNYPQAVTQHTPESLKTQSENELVSRLLTGIGLSQEESDGVGRAIDKLNQDCPPGQEITLGEFIRDAIVKECNRAQFSSNPLFALEDAVDVSIASINIISNRLAEELNDADEEGGVCLHDDSAGIVKIGHNAQDSLRKAFDAAFKFAVGRPDVADISNHAAA